MQNPALATTEHPPTSALGVAPMGEELDDVAITIAWERSGDDDDLPVRGDAAAVRVVPGRRVGTGAGRRRPQDPQGQGDRGAQRAEPGVARRGVDAGGPEIPYHQVEIGPRKPLPFTRRTIEVDALQAGGRRRGRTGRAGGHRRRRLLGGLPVPRSHRHAHGAGRAARRAPVAAAARHARRGPRRRRHHRRAVGQGAPGARPHRHVRRRAQGRRHPRWVGHHGPARDRPTPAPP